MPPAESDEADVCLLLEGTYPYVQGGVSSWVNQIISRMPEVRFAIFYIGSRRDMTPKRFYRIPEHVIEISESYIFESLSEEEQTPLPLSRSFRKRFYETFASLYLGESADGRIEVFWRLIDLLDEVGDGIRFGNLCKDYDAWLILKEVYDKYASKESFIDFFWSTRFMHMPTWRLLMDRRKVPKARVYHSISTGYAGLIGSIAARYHNRPYFITEHGIYTKERIAEISQATWIHERDRQLFDYSQGLGIFKGMWIQLFNFLGRVTYGASEKTIALFDGNKSLQVEYGAPRERLDVIPNGIDPSRFDKARAKWLDRRSRSANNIVVGFVGRVVPIKDVKTLIRAASSVLRKYPKTQFLFAGPTEEDPDYFKECNEMIGLFKLADSVKFLGRQDVMDFFPGIDVMVLTSISEGLPLVIIEGYAVGVPVVTTDVGACRELVYGRSPEDKQLGPSGVLTKISSPDDTAAALVQFCEDPRLVDVMGERGRERVERFYVESEIIAQYEDLYRNTHWSKR